MARRIVINEQVRQVRALNSGGLVLEVGCGTGLFAKVGAQYLPIVTLDVTPSGQPPPPNFICADAEHLPFRTASFSAVVAYDVIEHLRNPRLFFVDAGRVLRANGNVVARTPNPESLARHLLGEKWFALQDPTHVNVHDLAFWRRVITPEFVITKVFTEGFAFLPIRDIFQAKSARYAVMYFVNIMYRMLSALDIHRFGRGENLCIVAENYSH